MLTLALPADGYLRLSRGSYKAVGKDASTAALTAHESLPARGPALVLEDGRIVRMLAGEDPLQAARDLARSGLAVAAGNVERIGGGEADPVTIVKVSHVVHPVTDVLEPPRPSGELAELITKAPRLDPLKPDHFDRISASLSSMVTRTAGKIEKRELERWLLDLDFDWSTATDAELRAASASLNKAMRGLADDVWVGVKGKVRVTAQRTATTSAASTVKTHRLKIGSHLRAKDRAAIDRAVNANAHYLSDYYGKMAPRLSAQMRNIVALGLDEGLGEAEIAEMLRRQLAKQLGVTSSSYYNVVSNAVCGRARSYSQLLMLDRAGHERYVIEAILDETTTNMCRMLHGKVFSVQRSLDRYAATDGLKDPTDVKFTQPMMTQRVIKSGSDKGKMGLYVQQRSGLGLTAVVEQSGVGAWDDVGRYSRAKNEDELQDMNLGAPPYHWRCRTVLLPYV